MTQKAITVHVVPFLVAVLIGAGCGDFSIYGTAPVANAGVDGSATVGIAETLDGSASDDEDGDIMFYAWTFISRPAESAAPIADETAETTTFTPDEIGDYVIQLTVIDNDGLSGSATVTYTATNVAVAPIADAGEDRFVIIPDTVTLNASGSTGEIVAWEWTPESYPSVEEPEITNSDQEVAYFTADVCGDYIIELTVTDNNELSDWATVTYTAGPCPSQ
ncbi:PKD domain-containing protein [Thermodesulfobacteriota bacterium]